MSSALVKSEGEEILPVEAKVIRDPFRVMKLASKGVDKVRRAGNRELKAIGDGWLTRTRFICSTGFERLSDRQQEGGDDLIDLGLKTVRARAFNKTLRHL